MKRFVKEYANYRLAKINEIKKMNGDSIHLQKCEQEIKDVIRHYNKWLITEDDCMRTLANIDIY